MTSQHNHLLIIDPQNDFCDLPESYCTKAHGDVPAAVPALPVPGAHADMQRLAQFIDGASASLSEVTVTLDSHQHFDIGHPTFWRRADGSRVAAFTQVTANDVRSGSVVPRQPEQRERVIGYLEALEAAGRYVHMVWPVHCEIGSFGHNVHDDVRAAYNRWEEATLSVVRKVEKGKNPFTEHYSAIQAEVPDANDPETRTNHALISALSRADRVYIAGEAGSHCVKATTEHLVLHWPSGERARLTLLSDCMSPVAGFEAAQADFLSAMRAAGVRTLTSAEALAELGGSR